MSRIRISRRALLGLLVVWGCSDSSGPVEPGREPDEGTILVRITGGTLPAGGYTVVLDEAQSFRISTVPAELKIPRVSAGLRTLRLENIAEDCAAEANPRTVTVAAGATATIEFAIVCTPPVPGTILVRTMTGGLNPPDAYRVDVKLQESRAIPSTGEVSFSDVHPGNYWVYLASLPQHCEVDGARTREVTLEPGATVEVAFAVTCIAAPSLETVETTEVYDTMFVAKARVNPNGRPTSVLVQVGTRPGMYDGYTSSVEIGSGLEWVDVSHVVSTMDYWDWYDFIYPNTTYYYRMIADNGAVTRTIGPEQSVHTTNGSPPRITRLTAPNTSSAVPGGTIWVTVHWEDTERDVVEVRVTGSAELLVEVSRGVRSGGVGFTVPLDCTPPAGASRCEPFTGTYTIVLQDGGENESEPQRFSISFE